MSAQKKIPELYDAEDIRREACELERMAQLRGSVKKLRKLTMLPFVWAMLISVVIIGAAHGLLVVFYQLPSALVPQLVVFSLTFVYTCVVLSLQKFCFEEPYYDEVERLRRLFLKDHGYWDALNRMDKEYPAVAKKIRRMKYVTGEVAD
ncbi:MAG: hypothetical protein PHC53_00400 [Patescibacteria group bacterium]|nr:hypothetical protein [Patescibacteria group bacterium]